MGLLEYNAFGPSGGLMSNAQNYINYGQPPTTTDYTNYGVTIPAPQQSSPQGTPYQYTPPYVPPQAMPAPPEMPGGVGAGPSGTNPGQAMSGISTAGLMGMASQADTNGIMGLLGIPTNSQDVATSAAKAAMSVPTPVSLMATLAFNQAQERSAQMAADALADQGTVTARSQKPGEDSPADSGLMSTERSASVLGNRDAAVEAQSLADVMAQVAQVMPAAPSASPSGGVGHPSTGVSGVPGVTGNSGVVGQTSGPAANAPNTFGGTASAPSAPATSGVGPEGAPGPGGGGGGGGGSVICSELHRQNKLDEATYVADSRFGRGVSPLVLLGYQVWGRKVVKAMRRSQRTTKAVQFMAMPAIKAIAKRAGHGEGSAFGEACLMVGIPVCAVIGFAVQWARFLKDPVIMRDA
jgi:hypothetical protein